MTDPENTTVALEVLGKSELLQISRAPEVVLQEAHKAAAALQKVINGKARKVIMNGEQYLEFEDLQTLARFYGVTTKVEWSRTVEFEGVRGFEARAVAISAGGQELSAADSMCLSDEQNWKNKPLFMLRSMAQTRACAKALRNVLAWVVVLAGYRPTPAEEMHDVITSPAPQKPRQSQPDASTGHSGAQRQAPSQPVLHVEQSAAGGPVTLVGCKAISFTAKTGKNAGKTSEFYAVTFRDAAGTELEAATFDKKLADAADVLTGRRVMLEYKPGKRPGKFELVSLEPEQEEQAQEEDRVPF